MATNCSVNIAEIDIFTFIRQLYTANTATYQNVIIEQVICIFVFTA